MLDQTTTRDSLAPFICLGVEFKASLSSPTQGVADCPFCGKEDHFYVGRKTGQWDCKVCGEKGNIPVFLEKICRLRHTETTDEDFKRLAKLRGLPTSIFKRWGMARHGTEWWLPVYSEKGTVRDVRRWDGDPPSQNHKPKLKSTTGCGLQLFGMYDLVKARTERPRDTLKVFVCEGEFDAMALRWLLDLSDRQDEIVVGVPGANTFKSDWGLAFKNCICILCYDNDEAGDVGSERAAGMLSGFATQTLYLCWPEALDTGYDVRDWVVAGRGAKVVAVDHVAALESLIRQQHRREQKPEEVKEILEPASFDDMLAVYHKWYDMNESSVEALAVSCAVVLANDVKGLPIWMYIVGPAGSGKTSVLMPFSKCPQVSFHSNIGQRALVSGFNQTPDPSLIPELIGKTAVFKDGTELISMHPDAKREIYSILRGAFDGHVIRQFGNGIRREYFGQFNILIGVTNEINADNFASVGERFLKYQIVADQKHRDEMTRRAGHNTLAELRGMVTMQEELEQIAKRYFSQKVDLSRVEDPDPVMMDKLVALAHVVARLRAGVSRDNSMDRDMKFRPEAEVPTRLLQQLVKLSQMLCVVFNIAKMDYRVLRMVSKIATDSSTGFHVELVRAMMNAENGTTLGDVVGLSKLPPTLVKKVMDDLAELGVMQRAVDKSKANGLPVAMVRWGLSPWFRTMWQTAFDVQTPQTPNNGHPNGSKPKPRIFATDPQVVRE